MQHTHPGEARHYNNLSCQTYAAHPLTTETNHEEETGRQQGLSATELMARTAAMTSTGQ